MTPDSPSRGGGWHGRSLLNGLSPSKRVYRLPFLPTIITDLFCEAYPAFVASENDESADLNVRSQESVAVICCSWSVATGHPSVGPLMTVKIGKL